MHKKLLIPVLLTVSLLCSSCGGGTTPDLSGTYTDRQGTAEIYSELDLEQTGEGVYSFSLSLYRLALLEGTAEYQDGILHFVSEQPRFVEGDITVSGSEASVTITESELPEITPDHVFRFPDGPAG